MPVQHIEKTGGRLQAVASGKTSSFSKGLVFARHETFHPRFGWLKKGFDQASLNSGVFLQDDAPVVLGVGKNMVRSIRYWCAAFKLLQDDQPTDFGTQLLDAQGWDPYLEDPASLWLLHWQLLEPPCMATVWMFTFHQFNSVEFMAENLIQDLKVFRDRESPRTADSSLKKDVSCLLRMYVQQPLKHPGKPLTSEESLDCPFTQLGLIHTAGESNAYTFRVGCKSTLPAAVIAYACLRHADRAVEGGTMPIAKLLYDPGSPGSVFKLTESVICSAIETIGRQSQRLRVSDAAGKLQFSFDGDPSSLADECLHQYYANSLS